ncbi:MAG TPA: polymorphic toxin-type HINT domain-containing protein [Chthonomonadaceae bacterium]|nr:polymorphic toxin-type HINT domain-containing protein [Chthonomonadaceae bacterium]
MSSARRRVQRALSVATKPVSASSSASRLPIKWLAGSVALLLLTVFALAWKFVPAHSAPVAPAQPAAFAAGTPLSFSEIAPLPSPLHQEQEIQMVSEGGGWKRADQLNEGDKVWHNGKWMIVKSIKPNLVTETKEELVPVKPPSPKPREETTLELDRTARRNDLRAQYTREETTLELDLSQGGDTFDETLIVPADKIAALTSGIAKQARELKPGDRIHMKGDYIALVKKVQTKWYTPPPPSIPDENGNVISRVIGTTRRMTDRILYLHTDGETIETTPEHPFSIEGKGWVQAGRLQPGALIKTEDGKIVAVQSLEVKAERKMVYNLKVEGTENFFVGKNRLLVHNGGGCVPEILSAEEIAKTAPGEIIRRMLPGEYKTLAVDAIRDNSKLALMSAEQRAVAARAYEAVAGRTVGTNAELARLYNLERARFFRGEVDSIPATAQEFGRKIGYLK